MGGELRGVQTADDSERAESGRPHDGQLSVGRKPGADHVLQSGSEKTLQSAECPPIPNQEIVFRVRVRRD